MGEFDAQQEMFTVLNGTGNIDFFRTQADGHPFEGMTLASLNPATQAMEHLLGRQ
ncbi:MAG: hypothetical protein WDO16_16665 [Bacteroidota bacterium]